MMNHQDQLGIDRIVAQIQADNIRLERQAATRQANVDSYKQRTAQLENRVLVDTQNVDRLQQDIRQLEQQKGTAERETELLEEMVRQAEESLRLRREKVAKMRVENEEMLGAVKAGIERYKELYADQDHRIAAAYEANQENLDRYRAAAEAQPELIKQVLDELLAEDQGQEELTQEKDQHKEAMLC